jgi:hypothetical protein
MNNNNTLIKYLAVVLVVLAAIWGFKNYTPKSNIDNTNYTKMWQTIKPDAVTAINVKLNDKEVALVKDGGTWKIDGAQADNQAVKDLLTNIITPAQVTVVAETNARHSDFGIASTSAQLVVQAGDQKQTMLVGTTGTGGRYVAFAGQDMVYLVPGLPTMVDSVSQNDWIDKTLVAIKEEAITKLTIERKGVKLTLDHTNGTSWNKEGETTVLDPSTFNAAISTLSSMMTQGLVDKTNESQYAAEPTVTVTAERKELGPVTLKFYASKDTAKVTSSERAGNYAISSSVMDNFTFDPNTLKPLPSPTPTPKS